MFLVIPSLSDHGAKILHNYKVKYAQCLLRRCQARLGLIEGAKRFSELVPLIETFTLLAEKKKRFRIWVTLITGKKPPPVLEHLIEG